VPLGYERAVDENKARQRLEARRTHLEQVLRAAESQAPLDEPQTGIGDPGGADQHTADAATDTLEREMALSMREATEGHLRDLDRAERRLEDGTYGICAVCQKPIPDGRLEAKPEAEYCVEHEPPPLESEGAA